MIGRRSSASSSFVLAAARLRALQQDSSPHGDATRAATRKIPNNSQAQPGDTTQVTGQEAHTLLTPVALMGAAGSSFAAVSEHAVGLRAARR